MTLLHFIGLLLLVFGVISIIWGDMKISTKEDGIIMKMYNVSPVMAKWRKWAIGLGSIYAGVSVLAEAGMPSF